MISRIVSWLRRRAIHRLHEGDEVILWPACDLREDHMVVDLSRLADEDLIGIKCRLWGALPVARGQEQTPDYPDEVKYIKALDLWTCIAAAERRAPREGKVVELWTGTHYEERIVVDMSRIGESLIGIKRRCRALGESHVTDFPDSVEYIKADEWEGAP